MDKDALIARFEIPKEGYEIIGLILRPEEQEILLALTPGKCYGKEELCRIVTELGIRENAAEAEGFLEELFHRGVVNHGEDGISYVTGTFYGRLDIFATEETETYDSLSRETKERLDQWYFKAYLDSLGPAEDPGPTEDEVLPLEEVLAFIDGREDTPYLAKCDCRRLIQNCAQPTDTCITYRTAPNSFVRRGQARPITREEAREIVKRADRRGLIHTVNPGGICSCCTDCCYLFRAAKARSSLGVWPKVSYAVKLDQAKCINCGACRKRCRFSVFTAGQELQISRPDQCQGCGLCVTGCPSRALSLEKRNG
ncbi:MAG: 4Fe-4S binding protein [Lachnospiraceae bacterium]|nr:4Fe-4S binding protein [Lachnospiraceae bacterium]